MTNMAQTLDLQNIRYGNLKVEIDETIKKLVMTKTLYTLFVTFIENELVYNMYFILSGFEGRG